MKEGAGSSAWILAPLVATHIADAIRRHQPCAHTHTRFTRYTHMNARTHTCTRGRQKFLPKTKKAKVEPSAYRPRSFCHISANAGKGGQNCTPFPIGLGDTTARIARERRDRGQEWRVGPEESAVMGQ